MTMEEAIQLAEKGDLGAAIALGDYYMKKNTGEGISEAVKWYEKAAEKNVMYAMHMTVLGKKIQAYAALQIAGSGDFGYEFAMNDWKDVYDWAEREVRCLDAHIPGSEGINYDEAIANRNNAAYFLALLYYFMDRYNDAIGLVQNLQLKGAMVLKGLCMNELAKDVEAHEKAYEYLRILDGDIEYASSEKAGLEEVVYSLAIISLSIYYRIGIGNGMRKEDPEAAVRLLQFAQMHTKVEANKELIGEEMARYKKKLFGGYRYIE